MKWQERTYRRQDKAALSSEKSTPLQSFSTSALHAVAARQFHILMFSAVNY